MKAIAFANNDIAVLAWVYDARLAGCMGFAVYRINSQGKEEALPAMARFKGVPKDVKQTTEQGPVQKFWWKDVYAKRGGTYRYRIQPLGGRAGALKPLAGVPALTTNAVTLTPDLADLKAYFNRGIVATQALSRALKGKISAKALTTKISDPKSPVRVALEGQLQDALCELLNKADDKEWNVFGALYELNDPKGLEVRLQAADRGEPRSRTIILGNERSSGGKGKKAVADVDAANRKALHAANVNVTDRILPNGSIPHNKYLILKDGTKPQAVLTGSTNWTMNALAAQTNNALIINSPVVAEKYEAYWEALAADCRQADKGGKWQGQTLRDWNREHNDEAIQNPINLGESGARITPLFSPNTKGLLGKNPSPPDDLAYLFKLVAGAKQAVLFLAFDPGNNSILDAAGRALKAKPNLFVRGALTSPVRAANFAAALTGKASPAKKPQFKVGVVGEPGSKTRSKSAKGAKKHSKPADVDYRAVPAGKVTKDDKFGAWEEELGKAGFAIIHDKIVVIDPFSDDCVVALGSHNLGYRASHNNDENLVIIQGHRPLAQAYTCHVLDLYDHYAFRYWLQKFPKQFGRPLDETGAWQDRYLTNGKPKSPELRFWLSSDPVTVRDLPSAPAPRRARTAARRRGISSRTARAKPGVR